MNQHTPSETTEEKRREEETIEARKHTSPSQVQNVPLSLVSLLSITGIIAATDSVGVNRPVTSQSIEMLAMSLYGVLAPG